MYRILISALLMIASGGAFADEYRWGDQADGSYANPILNADYSDPDVIRVGDRFYMTCSEFHFMGMPILESEDMVNWRLIGRVYDSIDLPGYSVMAKYAEGTWAPALRYHDGKFYIYVCTPSEGLFMTTATDPAGPWEPLHLVKGIEKWEDPCPFWDEDGEAYLVRSRHRAGPIIIHRMSHDGRELLDDGVTVYHGPVAEGPKIFKKDGYYYISIPEGGVSTGWQTILRSRDIYGPYESRRVLETGSTRINGPHQGALVDTPDGSQWWFYHFQNGGVRGRVVHLQPVEWREGFPFIGADYDGNGIGEPMRFCPMPSITSSGEKFTISTSDDFSSPRVGLQWQFNHNPDTAFFAIDTINRSFDIIPQPADILRNALNQLTQRLTGYRSEATVRLDFSMMQPGDRAGLECIGKEFHGAGVMIREDGIPVIYAEADSSAIVYTTPLPEKIGHVYLRLTADAPANSFSFYYSLDGKDYTTVGEPFRMQSGFWKGVRPGLYAYTTSTIDAKGVKSVNPSKARFTTFRYHPTDP
ncbi:MAG: glycoside hydrolase 43 family protein [Lachnoclostridium sp.]|nr:glycoside hydrolase 43 family protein [Lachnoclostridium sp.]